MSKVDEAASAEKFRKVGVDAVVSPARMGGRRIAHEMTRPEITSFLDSLLGPAGETLGLAEMEVVPNAPLAGKTLRDADLRARTNCLVLGVRGHPAEAYHFNPAADWVLEPGAGIMVLGDAVELGELRQLVAERS